jgi:GNAT superfamily N-acetyltransferase
MRSGHDREGLPRLLRSAHGDAWQALGRIHEAHGGGTASVTGGRLMASGIPLAQYNNVDVEAPEVLDLDAVRAWYAGRDVPWGARLPAGTRWTTGRLLFRKALWGLVPASFRPAPAVPGLVVEPAVPEDLDAVLRIDGEAFGGDTAHARRWLAPLLSAPSATVVLARLHGRPVGTAYVVRSEGAAGPAAYLGGVGVVSGARRRGVAGAMSSWLVASAFTDGVHLAHCHPDSALAARVYERLGFVEAAALDVYVDLA